MESALHYKLTGSGPCLLLVHGYCDDMRVWQEVAKPLSARFQVLMVDLPGHGGSGAVDCPVGFEHAAEMIVNVIESLGIRKLTVLGHSMGGYVALAFAQNYTDLIHRLILVNSHPFPDSEKRIERRRREMELIRQGKLSLIHQMQHEGRFLNLVEANEHHVGDFVQTVTEAGALWALQSMCTRPDFSGWLLQSGIPFACFLSPFDDKVDFGVTQQWIGQSANGQLVTFEQSNHFCFEDEPQRFVQIVGQIAKGLC